MTRSQNLSLNRPAGKRGGTVVRNSHVRCVAVAVIWLGHRDATSDGRRTADSAALTAAACTRQTLTASELVLKSVLDWIAAENVISQRELVAVLHERRFHNALRDRVVALPQVAVASVFDRSGNLVSSTISGSLRSFYVADRAFFRAELASGAPISVSWPPVELHGKPSTIFVALGISSRTEHLLGVATVGIDPAQFASFFDSISLREDISVSLFRFDGSLLATTSTHPEPSWTAEEDAVSAELIRNQRALLVLALAMLGSALAVIATLQRGERDRRGQRR